jgi:Fe-S cluster assembly protein SufD
MQTKLFKLDEPGTIDLRIPFLKEGEEMEIVGFIDANKPGDYQVKVLADHVAKNTYGRILIKGVGRNGARIKIDGMVKVEKNASKTNSFLEMRVLLVDDSSTAVAEPKLEIENNDVKASHAATVGKIDEDQIFYLKSRGLAEDEAREVIVEGFLKDIINKFHDDFKELASKINYV